MTFDSSISELDLSSRAYNVLEALGIATIGELVALRPRELLKARNCGKLTLGLIRAELQRNGLDLANPSPREVAQLEEELVRLKSENAFLRGEINRLQEAERGQTPEPSSK